MQYTAIFAAVYIDNLKKKKKKKTFDHMFSLYFDYL